MAIGHAHSRTVAIVGRRFWDEDRGGSCGLHEILLCHNVQKYEMKTLSKVVTFQKWKDLCILNETSWNDTIDHVLRASVC